jgi:putative effector of murein hydrolase
MMIAEHSLVVLIDDHLGEGLHVGVVVHIYGDGKAYEVEFVDGDGSTIALLTLGSSDVRPIEAGELLHTRRRA